MNNIALPSVCIETKRFTLVPHHTSDFAESAAMWADPVVARYTTSYTLTKEAAWFRLLRNIGHWKAMQYGHWVIREKISNIFIGEGGFSDYKRDIPIVGDPCVPEVSLALVPFAHHKGFSLEILKSMLAWGDQYISLKRSMCLIYPQNTPAIRIAQHVGFTEQTEVLYKGEINFMFIRSADIDTKQ